MVRAFLLLSAAILVGAWAIPARADCPSMMAPTLEDLHHCVQHAATSGVIDNEGVATSLLAKVSAAEAAAAHGDLGAAVNILQAFINEVQAQSGVHIEADHAEHMIQHVGAVIDALTS